MRDAHDGSNLVATSLSDLSKNLYEYVSADLISVTGFEQVTTRGKSRVLSVDVDLFANDHFRPERWALEDSDSFVPTGRATRGSAQFGHHHGQLH
jgi:hypothetical protein